MEKTIMIDGIERKMRVSALIPMQYRYNYNADIIQDMAKLQKNYEKALKDVGKNASEEDKNIAQLGAIDLMVFARVAFLMMKNAGEDIGDTVEEWLDSIENPFSIYEILPSVFELWAWNNATHSTPAKK